MKRPIINRRSRRIYINHPDPLASGSVFLNYLRVAKWIKLKFRK